MAFSRTLLAVLNSWVLTRWRLACIIYDIVLATEFFSCFLGNRFLYPLCETRVLLFRSAVTSGLSVLYGTFPELSVFNTLSPLFVFSCVVSLTGMCLITKSYFFFSDLHMSCFLLFHTTCVISNLRLCATHLLLFCAVASVLHPIAFLSSFWPTCLPLFLTFLSLSHLNCCAVVSSFIVIYLFLCPPFPHRRYLSSHCSFYPFIRALLLESSSENWVN